MTKPNFLIVGAPKCGTTSLYEYLKLHPDVYMAGQEVHYFGKDLEFGPRRYHQNLAEYMTLFEDWSGQKAIGEKSVWYFFSESAPAEIQAMNPDMRIIIMLRNPVNRLYSNYFQLRQNLMEDIPTFEEALAAEPDRRAGRRIPAEVGLVRKLYYRENLAYTPHVKRYLDTFGEQVKIIIFDDFKSDMPATYWNLLMFLNIDTNFQPDFTVHNPSQSLRSDSVERLRRRSKKAFKLGTLRPLVPGPVVNLVKQRIMPTLMEWNTVEFKKPPLDPTLRRQLQEEARPDIEALSELLNRDLTHWCEISK